MIPLEEDKIIKFRKRLYQKKVPLLFKSGGPDLNPIEKCRVDQQGKIVISTNDIISFFFFSCRQVDTLDIERYFSNLYLLFTVLTKESENYSFVSDSQILEKDIQEADNKITIKYLTKNLINIFFDNISLYNGVAGYDPLEKNLAAIIKKSNDGRNYQTLVEKTLEALIDTLKTGKPWRQSFEDIQKAALVCKLVGERLPPIEKNVLSKIVLESRNEIKKSTLLLGKISDARKQLNRQVPPHKEALKVISKLAAAETDNLKKIDDYLCDAYKFMTIIGASVSGFLGQNNEDLKNQLARLFFEYRDPPSKGSHRTYSVSRHRMARLFKYPELTRFTRSLQHEEKYQGHYMDLFTLFFNELIRQMDNCLSIGADNDFKFLENCLSETIRLVEKLDLEKSSLIQNEKNVRENYLSLLKAIPLDQISPLLEMKEDFCRVIQDDSRELLEEIRKNLIDICYSSLLRIKVDSVTETALSSQVRKLITGYSLHYKPQRFFYQNFFGKYICRPDGSLSVYLGDLIKTRKPLVMAILDIFSSTGQVGDLISREQIKFSENFQKMCLKRL